ASLIDLPVLVRLHTGNFSYFSDSKPDGSDLRFIAADDKTPLKFHVERYDSANQLAYVWVRVPHVAAKSSDFIWMYYGNAKAVAASEPGMTYDATQAAVFHFDNATGIPQDQTANKNTISAWTAQPVNASLIGGGAAVGNSKSFTVNTSPSLRFVPEAGATISMWIRLNSAQKDADIIYRREGDSSLVLSIDGNALAVRYRNANGKVFEIPRAGALTPNVWYHVALTMNASRIAVVVNGTEAAAVNAAVTELGGNIVVGASDGGANALDAELDELQFARAARSAEWLKAQAHGEGGDAMLLSYGDDEQRGSSESTSYFTIILRNVTIDGWVVIGFLALMAVISWIVMIGKGYLIMRVRKDNQSFLEQFKKLGASDPAILDANSDAADLEYSNSPISMALFGKHDHFQSSALYHIYHAGIQEVNHRVGRSVGAQAAGLSQQSVNAIRASLDAAVVRETQKINAQMVLLTIAISGGPFLGLLGTVVGVMITFAAIAAAGDVNINAIAPGIAAALVATVAGLAVAIPALFGYNYLMSRIKECIADMHVFVDEFVTRIAEHYSR
ncbi:MAG: DUF2341 domain-containing protein, partial [Gammaproteobacteria bacterium]|nr:DUF2341 domain-containing protein [Gammaproteobacteria bacterium]